VAFLARHPRLAELLTGLGLLAAAWVGARLLSWLFARLLARARGTPTAVDDRLVSALRRPVTWSLFLLGAWAAVHRSPLPERLQRGLDGALFLAAVALVALCLARAFGILLAWYTEESRHPSAEGLAREFGPLVTRVGEVFIVVVAAITVLQRFGVNVQSLVVSLGVGSLAVGLAAQDTLANMFAGFTLMLDRPFKAGDRVMLAGGEQGDVEGIGMRATRIRTLDETLLVVPNSLLVKERLTNLSRPTRAQALRVEVAVAYGSDLGKAKAVLAQASRECPEVDPAAAPLVLVSRLGDSGVHLTVVAQARDYERLAVARSQVCQAVYERLREAGVEIPYPTRTVIQREA
jgi:small-conductance mechanosensitive channel